MSQNPVLPTLYKINNKGKIRKWNICIVNDDDKSYKIITTFGDIVVSKHNEIQEKKMQTHVRIIEKGKAGRALLQQAVLEATSKWNEKKNRETYNETFTESKTDTNTTNFRPMLANSFQKHLYEKGNNTRSFKLTFPLSVQRKFDGIRCVVSKNQNNKISMNSRKGVEIFNFNDIKEEIELLYSNESCNNNIIFDGELYTKALNFETISGIVRQVDCTNEDIKHVEYHIYDVFDSNNPSWSFQDRTDFIKNISGDLFFNKIKIVETIIAENMEQVDDYHRQFIDEGFEGIMLRQTNGLYEENKRSKFLQKLKLFMEEEFEIINFHDGEGHDKNMVIWECKTGCGKLFSVKPRGTFEERRIMFATASTQIGRFLTVIFQEYSADGIPRFPVGKSIRDMSF